MTAIQAFSDWMLAALPRLFLYPGGLWLLGALVVLRATSGGRGALRPGPVARDFLASRPLSLALGWVAVALLPLPGATTLPVPPDRLVLVALPLLSLACARFKEEEIRLSVWTMAGITLALLVPLVGEGSLFVRQAGWAVSDVLVMIAVGMGLLALWREATREPSAGIRWLAWLGLGATPLMDWDQAPVAGPVWASGVYLVLILVLGFSARYLSRRVDRGLLAAIAGGLSLAALLLALVGF